MAAVHGFSMNFLINHGVDLVMKELEKKEKTQKLQKE
jgi:hypothetical protein